MSKKENPAMPKKKVDEFRTILLKERAALLHDLELEQDSFIYNDQGDLVDIADSVILNDLINRLSDMDADKLKQIDRALEKIEDGSYGICEGTGKPIPEARLKAVPWTPYSIEYAESLEKTKNRKYPRAPID
ncbi:MAG: TraR/DksA family transcriptional regulator [Leptonema illini]|jgi:RNA polymerase-binding protein DksA|uniref:Transcriptional regulator, TraR/DksA family n=2 Tax=Leptonema illini TaxID=183 RepID=H2CKK1_9LEPT|nr:TraR/DksA family transcriptional regulator [Leptonema illini]EHQ05056.1 transcriptional regulator, TraR/DksA family [Leptonema illini DSM 21528]KAB2928869.1 MAG: TraR/DksA family transcriptional regulator [Leptonema illini]PKL31657.1 MAG: molecular chaperone DnaK [Spirochaetae bacterium HGW-Spirochaetae-10]